MTLSLKIQFQNLLNLAELCLAPFLYGGEKRTKLYPESLNLIQFVLVRFPPRFIHISTLVLTSLLPEKP